jgi:hypothetical protein
LRFVTEFGRIDAEPGEIVVIPRGVKFPAELSGGPARGCTCESCGGPFTVAERGPIDANCPRLPRRFGRHHPARLHAAAWPGSPDLRSRQPFELKPVKLTGARGDVRDPLAAAHDDSCLDFCNAAGRLRRLLEGT